MKTILLLKNESGSSKPRLRNVPGSKVTQRPSEGTPGCNCDRWGHPFADRALESQMATLQTQIVTLRSTSAAQGTT